MLSYVLFSLVLGVIAALCSINTNDNNVLVRPVIVGLSVFVIFLSLNYWLTPVLKFWGFDGIWVELTIATFAGAAFGSTDDFWENFFSWRSIPFALCLLAGLIRFCASTEMFHSRVYSELLQPTEVADSTFNGQVHPIPVEKMISVNQVYAEDLASKRIENMPSLGSRCKFGSADMINLNGSFEVKTAEGETKTLSFDNEKVWVLPLEHTGYFKWSRNKVTTGYCIVSAHDPSRIFFVTEVNGKPIKMRYLSSAWFSDNLERHIRSNGYAGYGLTEYSTELDDNGNIYAVVTVFEPTIGFSGEDAVGVLVVDLQSGDITEYSIDDAPAWVDRIQPDEFLLDQIDDWGGYQNGFWNRFFTQDGVREATPGMSLVYSEGRSYWYSGIQSAGADKSSSGFMLIDTRTKECKLYPVAGINEQAAKDVVEAQSEWVRMSSFKANDPVLSTVHGVPTYFMTLTGDGVKNAGYAFVSLKSELNFAAAATPQEALAEYLKKIQQSDKFSITDGDKIAKEILTMTVRDVVEENGTYFVLFEEVKGKEFTGTSASFPELKWTKKGQKVEVSYTDTEAKIISLDTYDLIDFEI